MKALLTLAALVLAGPALAYTSCTSIFALTPDCCNGAFIETVCEGPHAVRFEYYKPKANGTCQHVKQVCGAGQLPGYTHVGCDNGADWATNTLLKCCFNGSGTCQYIYVPNVQPAVL